MLTSDQHLLRALALLLQHGQLHCFRCPTVCSSIISEVSNILLWGDRLEGYPPAIEKEARHIPAGYHYHFLNNILKQAVRQQIGGDGEISKDFETYLTDQDGAQWVARFRLLIIMTNGVMTIHTQQLGVAEQDWKSF